MHTTRTRKSVVSERGPIHPVVAKLAAGACAGVCGQTVSYPLDTIRRILQVQDLKAEGHKDAIRYSGMIDAATRIVRTEGPGALYRGILPNYIKVIPSVSISFLAFENAKEALTRSLTDEGV
mmetsp:Transcript_21499/g.38624  ORF Transcript_21499/g.38624 Transcript_21499/m.38624 type:complete len:122 (-) Transcript_21499:641-1006(-)